MFDNYCFSNYFSSPESNKKEIVEEQSDPKKSATTTIRTNKSTMKSRSRNTNYEKVNSRIELSSDNDDTFTEKPIVVTGGASDLYSKFKRRHRFKSNRDSTTVSTPTTYAQVIVNNIGFFIKNLNKECVFHILWKSSCYT